jgi:hypothetical protein
MSVSKGRSAGTGLSRVFALAEGDAAATAAPMVGNGVAGGSGNGNVSGSSNGNSEGEIEGDGSPTPAPLMKRASSRASLLSISQRSNPSASTAANAKGKGKDRDGPPGTVSTEELDSTSPIMEEDFDPFGGGAAESSRGRTGDAKQLDGSLELEASDEAPSPSDTDEALNTLPTTPPRNDTLSPPPDSSSLSPSPTRPAWFSSVGKAKGSAPGTGKYAYYTSSSKMATLRGRNSPGPDAGNGEGRRTPLRNMFSDPELATATGDRGSVFTTYEETEAKTTPSAPRLETMNSTMSDPGPGVSQTFAFPSSTSTGEASSARKPPIHRSQPSIASSIDDAIPPHPHPPIHESSSPPVPVSPEMKLLGGDDKQDLDLEAPPATVRQRFNSLNPSNSRFTLSLPLPWVSSAASNSKELPVGSEPTSTSQEGMFHFPLT